MSGFRPLRKTVPAPPAGFVLGRLVFLLRHPVSTDPLAVLNNYAQVLTITIAEVAV